MADLQTDFPEVYSVVYPYIQKLNTVLTNLVGGFENMLILVICILIGYALKNRNNWNWIIMILVSLLFFGGLRYLSIGA